MWVIWFYRAKCWCIWILQALRNPVSECFSSGHRTGWKLSHVSTIEARPPAHLGLSPARWEDPWWGTCVLMGHFFCCSGPLLPISRSACCRLWAFSWSTTSYSRSMGTPSGVRSSGTRLLGLRWWGLSIAVLYGSYMHLVTVWNLASLYLKSQPISFCGKGPPYFIKIKNRLWVSSSATFIQGICVCPEGAETCWQKMAHSLRTELFHSIKWSGHIHTWPRLTPATCPLEIAWDGAIDIVRN